MARHRKYSDSEKAEALAVLDANNGNKKKTAAELQIPRSNLVEWQQGNGVSVDVPKLRHGKKLELADRIEEVVWQIVEAMPGKIDKAGLKDAAISMGTGIDKAQLLRGDPTSITASADRQTFLQSELTRLRAVHANNYAAYDQSVRQLQQLFTDTTDPAYDPLLDYTKHPENWPDVKAQDAVADAGDGNN